MSTARVAISPRDREKLLRATDEILAAPFDLLKDPDYLTAVIREAELFPDPRRPNSVDALSMKSVVGLLQIPRELAEFLILLSTSPIRRALEIGTYIGWTTAILTAYLYRWNPMLEVISIDPEEWCPEEQRIILTRLLPIRFARMTSAAFAGHSFDLCFIDGDHSYAGVAADYARVGRQARICAFHDANDYVPFPGNCQDDEVPRFWEELKQRECAIFREIFHSPPGCRVMGIGVRIRP
jgi:predicted O-methyltransferase YrrM